MTAVSCHRPLRVVQVGFIADPERRDGESLLRAWPTLGAVACAVARSGVNVAVMHASHRRDTVYRDGVTFRFVEDHRAAPLRLPFGARWPRRPATLLGAIASAAPDVVHVHGFHYPLAIRQLHRVVPGVPILIQDHASGIPSRTRRVLWRWASAAVAGVAFTTHAQAAALVAAGALRKNVRIFEVLEGSSCFTPGEREAARQRTGLSGTPAFLWTGHLDANKDPLVALDAFRLAAAQLPDARLWCCFVNAPLLEQVKHRIGADPLLVERVRLLGARSHAELEHYFRAADLFVQMSHREGCGYSVIEALACGTPPLVSDIPPFRRIVGDAGALVPVGDATTLARAMVDWANRDPAAVRRAARARFESALSFDSIGRELRRIYETLAVKS